MHIEEILSLNEGKTLEFKENALSLQGILKTVVAFANTAGGTIVLGVEDGTKKVIGVANPLKEEERLASAITQSITPFMVPDIQLTSYRDSFIIFIHIPHMAGPYYITSAGPEKGVYVRFGSTNRVVDSVMLTNMKLLAQNKTYDTLPYLYEPIELDWDAIDKEFSKVDKKVTPEKAELLGLITKHHGNNYPSYGGIILFGKDRLRYFPSAIIRCARFLGVTKAEILDQLDITSYPTLALDEALNFVRRNTRMAAEIGEKYRIDIPEYPAAAVREAITNALLHADYSVQSSTIMIAIFDDRMEISNPGGLVFGMTLKKALGGLSSVRNHVIAHTFRELKLIENWGSGLQRIIKACAERGLKEPIFEDLGNDFKVTLYSGKVKEALLDIKEKEFLANLKEKEKISTKEAAEFWKIASRNALIRLKRLVEKGMIKKIGTSPQDPYGKYVLVKEL